MRLKIMVSLFLLSPFSFVVGRPLIKKIENNTPYVYMLHFQNNDTECELTDDDTYFMPHYTSDVDILLSETSPGLVLQPIGYVASKDHKVYYFADDQGNIDNDQLDKAFKIWKQEHRSAAKNAEEWLVDWVGEKVLLTHNAVEIFGYLLNINMAKIENNNHVNHTVLSLSEGLFSRMMLHVTLELHSSKGVRPKIKAYVGQGGMCKEGKVIEL